MAGYKNKPVGLKLVCKNEKCSKLGRLQPVTNFYKIKNSDTPYYPYCKSCIEQNIDVNNLKEVQDFLKEIDRPFIMDVWVAVCSGSSKFIENYMKNITSKDYNNLTWKNSVFERSPERPREDNAPKPEQAKWNNEWQGEYTEEEIKYLNDYMEGLKKDFDISTVNHMDYAKEIAKTSLLKSKAYSIMLKDPSDDNIKAYKGVVSMFDILSKSAQFAESQRGANDVGLGSFGQIFDAVEKHNWVPTYVPDDKDMYDKLLDQFANIEKSI
jgi:hypothetical protein